MSLKSRLDDSVQLEAGRGCKTCAWLAGLPTADRRAFDDWLAEGRPITRLWQICADEGLQVTRTPFRDHVKHHQRAE